MKKLWLILPLGLLILVIGAAVVVRTAAKSFVESDEFKTELTRILEQGAGSVIPHAMARVQRIRLAGLATLEIQGLKIESTRSVGAQIDVPKVRATPALFSLLGKGPVRVEGEGSVGTNGRFTFSARVPKGVLQESDAKGIETFELNGTLEKVDVVGFAALMFSDAPSNPSFRLSRGDVTGSFSFKKPFGGAAAHGKKSGDINGKIERPAWAIAVGPVKKLEPPGIDLHVEIKDNVLELRAPVVFSEPRFGRATISGSLLLPERADRTMAWDLDVKSEGIVVQGSMAKLFKCKQPPTQPHFTVKGPIAATTCR